MREQTYGWYPASYDFYSTTNKQHFQTYDNICYKRQLPNKRSVHTLNKSRALEAEQKRQTDDNANLGLSITRPPLVRKTSPIPSPSKLWKTKVTETPLVCAQVKPEYFQNSDTKWRMNLSYVEETVNNAKTFVSPVKSIPIYEKAPPPYSTSLPIHMQTPEFGAGSKLSPFNENILRPVTTPHFYKRGTKIALTAYKPKRPATSVQKWAFKSNNISLDECVVIKKCTSTPGLDSSKTNDHDERCASAPDEFSDSFNKHPVSHVRKIHSAPPIMRRDERDLDTEREPQKEPQSDNETTVECHPEASGPLGYDEAVKKYGWRAQIPGDPFALVCLDERPSYSHMCPHPQIPPNPPVARRVNFDTFFCNTIPNRPKTFVVHSEWASEQLLAKRVTLQKREPQYHFKQYAFAY